MGVRMVQLLLEQVLVPLLSRVVLSVAVLQARRTWDTIMPAERMKPGLTYGCRRVHVLLISPVFYFLFLLGLLVI